MFQSGYDRKEASRKEMEYEAKRVKVWVLQPNTGDDFMQF